MQEVDAGTIVPSTRDLLQVTSTRRRGLALLAVVSGEHAGEEAARLADINVSALACVEPGPAMQAAASATKTVPVLCLVAASDRKDLLAARASGADGVCLAASLSLDDWDRLAKVARTMRMLPLALATDAETVATAITTGARAVVVRTPTAAEARTLVAKVPRTMTVIAHVEQTDADAVRSLARQVDAVVVPPSVHAEKGFAALVTEVDP